VYLLYSNVRQFEWKSSDPELAIFVENSPRQKINIRARVALHEPAPHRHTEPVTRTLSTQSGKPQCPPAFATSARPCQNRRRSALQMKIPDKALIRRDNVIFQLAWRKKFNQRLAQFLFGLAYGGFFAAIFAGRRRLPAATGQRVSSTASSASWMIRPLFFLVLH